MNFDEAKIILQQNPGSKLKRIDGQSFIVVDKKGNQISPGDPEPIGDPEPKDSEKSTIIYMASLPKEPEASDEITFYKSLWSKLEQGVEHHDLENDAYYFQIDNNICATDLSEKEINVRKIIGDDEFYLDWIQVATKDVPNLVLENLKKQFKIDGLEKLHIKLNTYAIIDEKAFSESSFLESSDINLDNNVLLFFTPGIKANFQQPSEFKNILTIGIGIIGLGNEFLWQIIEIKSSSYSDPDYQELDTTPLAQLDSEETHLLLSRKYIAQHIAEHAEVLAKKILNKLLNCEVQVFLEKARWIISDSLNNFTYKGSFQRRSYESRIAIPWLKTLMGGADEPHRHKFYNTINQYSLLTEIIALSSFLEDFTILTEKGFSYEKLLKDLETIASSTEPEECFLLLFKFLGKEFLVGIPPEELPSGTGSDIPSLEVEELEPVLLKTGLDSGEYLGRYYTHIATIKARVKTYTISDVKCFRIAEFVSDVTVTDLVRFEDDSVYFDNDLLENILKSRTPFHEKRLLHMLDIPCRQALADNFHTRIIDGLHPIQNRDARNYQTRDSVMLEKIKDYVVLENQLKEKESLESLENYLSQRVEETILGKMSILRKIASFREPLSNTRLQKTVIKFEDEFEDAGHYLMAALCRSVVGHHPDTKKVFGELIGGFWQEVQECFPDYGESWSKDPRSKNTVFTQYVLSSLFDRQITTFYDPDSVFNMPYDTMLWAINSIHHLQMMSAVFPMCCGDWVCTHNNHYNSRRLIWNHRIAAVAYPGRSKDNSRGGHIPKPDTNRYFFCSQNSCHHMPEDALLYSIAKALNLDEQRVARVLQKMGWWFNALIDKQLNSHFRCRKCEQIMYPPQEDNLNIFSCTETATSHDRKVYLNWCVSSFCDNIIDSRIESERCANGKLICRKCGCCCHDHLKKQTYTSDEITAELWVPACWACSTALSSAWKEMKQRTIEVDGQAFDCPLCGEKNHVFPSKESFIKRQKNSEKQGVAIQWNTMDQFYKYNTRKRQGDKYNTRKRQGDNESSFNGLDDFEPI